MKKFILFLNVLLLSASTFAQTAQVVLSDEMKVDPFFMRHLHSDATGHYVLFAERGKGGTMIPIIRKYDNKMKMLFSKEYKVDGKDIYYEDILYAKGKFIWISSKREKKSDVVSYYATPLDMKGIAGKPNLIASFTVDSKKDLPKAKFVVSNDTTKIGIVVTKDNDDNKEMAEAYVAVFDNNAEKLWNKKYNFKVSEKQFSVIDFDLLNNAEFLVLTKIYDNNSQKEEKRGSGKNEPAYDYFLNYFSKDSNEPRKLKLDLKGDFIMGGSLETTPASETYLFGFYSKKAGGIIQGMYNMKVASNGTVEYLNKKEFTDKELSVFEDKDVEKERGDKGISKFYEFTGFKIRKDGTMSIAAEDNYVQTTTTNKVTSYTYFSKSIIDIQMDDKGKISSFRIIPKKQATLNWRLGIGHETVNNENNTYYFYNEDEDNLKKPIEERGQAIKNFKQFVMVMTYFDPATGKPVRKALLDKDKVNQTLEPEHCVQIGDNTLFIVLVEHSNFSVSGTISSVLGKTLRLGTITVSE